jgi:peptide-O-fucosyltransferase
VLFNIVVNGFAADRAENLLHDHFGDVNYWGIRRAMMFAPHLGKIYIYIFF